MQQMGSYLDVFISNIFQGCTISLPNNLTSSPNVTFEFYAVSICYLCRKNFEMIFQDDRLHFYNEEDVE